MKISRALTALAVTSALALAGCSGGTPASSPSTGAPTATDKVYKIGITQIVAHQSLDSAREGFKEGLAAAGIMVTLDEKNANGEPATATTIAQQFNEGYDLILAIATPTAQASAQVITKTPVVFTAVTDPVAAQLVKSMEAPGANVTGTTDMNPVAEQIGLVKQVKADAKKLGIIYSSGEVNSAIQVKLAKEAAKAEGLEVVEKTITNTGEVAQAASALEGMDAIYIPTDNNVVAGLASVVQVCEKKKILLVSGDGDSVKGGAVITKGIDYIKLGHQTGQMAAKILKGANPATMPVETQKDLSIYVNKKAAARMGVTIPPALLEKAIDRSL